jgi:putrescine transport system permease protein
MIGRVLWTEFFSNRDWPLASALAAGLLVLVLVPAIVMFRSMRREAA